MGGKYNKLSFMAYINNPMSKESITMLYSANKITFEKCELYNDFIQSLLITIFDTYLGDDVMNVDEQFNHFQWCWDKTVNIFKKEGIIFNDGKLYDYFLEFTLEVFYSNTEKPELDFTDKTLLRIWTDIFNYGKLKTNSEVDTLIELYGIFEKSLVIE